MSHSAPKQAEHHPTLTLNDPRFLRDVERRSGAVVSACLQCHKCSSGCPIAPEMDVLPSQIMRMIHLGLVREVLGSRAIWLCASCAACTTRCPMDIDVASVMDALRAMAVARACAAPEARGRHFNESFLASVRRHGRVFELGMMVFYKLRTRDLFTDAAKAPGMFLKRKLGLLPRLWRSSTVREVFDRARDEEIER